jgi:prepilin-type N-terminal cleavage/methylation domain-containing protein/prepilin-type processing-associated H-X9-DG protein
MNERLKNRIRRLKDEAFTLIELLVVIAIIALLLSVLLPALRRAKASARSVVCRTRLKSLALANTTYAAKWDNWYVPVIDTTMTSQQQPTWNSNMEFRRIVGLEDASDDDGFVMPEEYLCPFDEQSKKDYWQYTTAAYRNYVSYGYNMTDWGPDSISPVSWSGNIPASNWACRFRVNDIQAASNKIMFVDAGDWAVYMSGADYKKYWDKYGQDIVRYRSVNMWYPVYYRHGERANAAYFDGRVESRDKTTLFYYNPPGSLHGDRQRNESLWFCNPLRRRP